MTETAGTSWLPATARALVLVSHSDGRWGASAALELAGWIGRDRPRTVLVNTIAGPSGPDSRLCGEGAPGLTDAMLGRRTVSEVAVREPSRSFIYIPAGTEPLPLRRLVSGTPFAHLVRAASRGGTLLLLVSAEDPELASQAVARRLGELFDGRVQLGEERTPLPVADWPPLMARVEVEKPAPADAAARSAGFSRPTSTPAIVARPGAERRPARPWEKAQRSLRKRVLSPGTGCVVAVFLATIVAVWLVWQAVSPSPPRLPELSLPDGKAKSAPEVEESPGGTLVEASPAPGSTSPGSVPAEGEATRARGVDLPYSVLVASYVRWADALDRSKALEADGAMAFVAPTVIGERAGARGGVYYRVFAGALEDRLQAGDLMRSLVEKKTKERERAWDMRPVALAFVLGDFDSEEEAAAERERLHESGLPAYVLAVDAAAGMRFRLYSGAFESEEAAAALDSMLTAAGRPSTLETRRGLAR